MKKTFFYLYLIFLSINVAGMHNATETMTLSTFFSNAWTGNSTFIADKHIPVIEENHLQFIIHDAGNLDQQKYPCQVNAKNIFNVGNFFELWTESFREKEKEEVIKILWEKARDKKSDNINKEKLLKCELCINKFSTNDITYFSCCKTDESVKLVCKQCTQKSEKSGYCPYCKAKLNSIDQSLGRFNIFLQQKLSEASNSVLSMNDIPFYILDKDTRIISKVKNKHSPKLFFQPNGNRVPLTTFIKQGAHFQTKATEKFLGVSVNNERGLIVKELLTIASYYAFIYLLAYLTPGHEPRYTKNECVVYAYLTVIALRHFCKK